MHNEIVSKNVRDALAEDIGSGDLTASLVDDKEINAIVVTREPAVVCGREWFDETFRQLNAHIKIDWEVKDGHSVSAGDTVCQLYGNAPALLSGERTALNFLQTLSGTATLVKRYVDAISATQATVLDTRKTIPGLRDAQKYAVTCGGGQNHRRGLYDAILIKENHIVAAGGVANVLSRARNNASTDILIEIEVEDLRQVKQALAAGARRLLLDNFQIDDLAEAVKITNGQAKLEASGGINLENILDVAQTGVDYISIGALTKDVQAIDFSMQFA